MNRKKAFDLPHDAVVWASFLLSAQKIIGIPEDRKGTARSFIQGKGWRLVEGFAENFSILQSLAWSRLVLTDGCFFMEGNGHGGKKDTTLLFRFAPPALMDEVGMANPVAQGVREIFSDYARREWREIKVFEYDGKVFHISCRGRKGDSLAVPAHAPRGRPDRPASARRSHAHA